jgi:hypothetical protein
MARVEDDDEVDGLNPKQALKLPVEGMDEKIRRQFNREADKAFAIAKQKILGMLKQQPPEEHRW